MTVQGLASRAEVLLDPRLAEVWQLIWGLDEDRLPAENGGISEEVLAGLLRLAYIQGYVDATSQGDGELYRELGIRDPMITRGRAERPQGVRRRPGSSGR